jgi:hypothetical protein
LARSPTPVVAIVAAVSPFFTNERRSIAVFILLHMSIIEEPPYTKSLNLSTGAGVSGT